MHRLELLLSGALDPVGDATLEDRTLGKFGLWLLVAGVFAFLGGLFGVSEHDRSNSDLLSAGGVLFIIGAALWGTSMIKRERL